MKTRRRLQRIGAFALGIALGLLAAEVLVRAKNKAASGTMTGRGVWSAPLTRYDQRLGWTLIPKARLRNSSLEYDVEVAINDAGFRQAAEPDLERGSGTARITLLGDSFVFGQGVEESQRWGEGVSAATGAEVVNRAVPAYGTDQLLLLYEGLEGPSTTSDVVILAHFLEAVVRNAGARRYGRAKPWFELVGDELFLRGVPVPQAVVETPGSGGLRSGGLAIPFKPWLQRNSALYGLLRDKLRRTVHSMLGTDEREPYPEYSAHTGAWPHTRDLFERFRDAVRARGARPVVVVVPDAWYVEHPSARAPEVIVAACAKLDLEVLDLTPGLRAASFKRRLYFTRDGHWTAAGHAVAAELLVDFLGERNLLKQRE